MQTKLLRPSEEPAAIEEAGALLRAGEVVGIPTETVYGLAADALNPQAVKRIFEAKGRPQDNPLIVHIADLSMVREIATEFPPEAQKLADAFWPGPLTIILPKQDKIPMVTSGGLNTVGIRFPVHPMAQAIIRAAGVPLAAPSANTSGRPSTTTAQHVMEDLHGKIAAVVDGGPCSVGVESTVVSLCGERPRLLRPGGISLEQLQSVLGEVDVDRALKEKIDDSEKVSAPGMKYRHYAPKADLKIVEGPMERVISYINEQAEKGRTGIICTEETRSRYPKGDIKCVGTRKDELSIASHLFAVLREFDEDGVEQIYSESFKAPGLGEAIMNRLLKAAGHQKVDVSDRK